MLSVPHALGDVHEISWPTAKTNVRDVLPRPGRLDRVGWNRYHAVDINENEMHINLFLKKIHSAQEKSSSRHGADHNHFILCLFYSTINNRVFLHAVSLNVQLDLNNCNPLSIGVFIDSKYFTPSVMSTRGFTATFGSAMRFFLYRFVNFPCTRYRSDANSATKSARNTIKP